MVFRRERILTGSLLLLGMLLLPMSYVSGQEFYFGNDLSYVNQMEDCGADFKENGVSKDVYQIYADNGNNLVRLRLWVDPSWQNEIEQPDGVKGQYSDFEDVKKAIRRSKQAGMQVLLDFHYSDFWADPNRQVVPERWKHVALDTDALADSVYQYTFDVLQKLEQDDLLPEMVQVGNETNGGMLLSREMNEEFEGLEPIGGGWERQEKLFNAGIQAVRDMEDQSGEEISIALHYAGVGAELTDWFSNVIDHEITDFDVIGFSYYYAWHGSSIEAVEDQVAELRAEYPDKKIIILETGYPWTTENFDSNPNIITPSTPPYEPLSKEMQLKYLVDLTKSVMRAGGDGVIFWESAWVSTPCKTPWGTGSSHDHVVFFEPESYNFIETGGGAWMDPSNYDETDTSTTTEEPRNESPERGALHQNYPNPFNPTTNIFFEVAEASDVDLSIYNMLGQKVDALVNDKMSAGFHTVVFNAEHLPSGIYLYQLTSGVYSESRRMTLIK